jgi:RNA polymerase sigma factor (sigma-70 family)
MAHYETESGQQLITLFKDGDESALNAIVKDFSKNLQFFTYNIVHDRETADEIVFDSFLKLWQHRDRIGSLDHIRSFLYVTARNASLDHVYSSKRQVLVDVDIAGSLKSTDVDVLTGMIHAELIQRIYTELEQLPAKYATIFKLSYLEGLSTDEVCQRLDITANAVFTARSKIISHLRKVLRTEDWLLTMVLLEMIQTKSW